MQYVEVILSKITKVAIIFRTMSTINACLGRSLMLKPMEIIFLLHPQLQPDMNTNKWHLFLDGNAIQYAQLVANYYWHKLPVKSVFNHITKTNSKRETPVSTCSVLLLIQSSQKSPKMKSKQIKYPWKEQEKKRLVFLRNRF